MKIQMLSVVFVERKAVDFKDKKCRLRGRNYQKKAAIVGALERKFRSIFISNSSSVNSGEKPAGFYEELVQKAGSMLRKKRSIFFENGDIFRAVFATTHL